MSNNIFSIDWRSFSIDLKPIDIRKPRFIAWINALIHPIKEIYQSFLKFKKQAIYKIEHTSQVCYMEGVLNDSFDVNQRRIYIKNGLFIEPLYIYTPNENKPVYIYTPEENKPQWIYSPEDLNNSDVDFIVFVPVELQPSDEASLNTYLSRMRALINYYKLASKTYKIEFYE